MVKFTPAKGVRIITEVGEDVACEGNSYEPHPPITAFLPSVHFLPLEYCQWA